MRKKIKKRIVLFGIFLLIFLFAGIRISKFYLELHINQKEHNDIVKKYIKKEIDSSESEVFSVDFASLLKDNKDVVGWIRYNSDQVNYPILQADNNDYYLKRAFNRSNNEHGSIFLDYRNKSFNDQNVVIYGHNTIRGRMFGSLNQVYEKDFFKKEDNKFIKIYTPDNEVLTYEVFSYYEIDVEEYYITTSFNTLDEFQTFIDTIKKRSYKKFAVPVTREDRILTLSTCHGSNGTPKRTVIHAKLIA